MEELEKGIVEKIGMPALLEQCAEECTELSQAALKLARKERGDNPTPKTSKECINNLTEEIADVMLCIELILENHLVSEKNVELMMEYKFKRWNKRLDAMGVGKNDC